MHGGGHHPPWPHERESREKRRENERENQGREPRERLPHTPHTHHTTTRTYFTGVIFAEMMKEKKYFRDFMKIVFIYTRKESFHRILESETHRNTSHEDALLVGITHTLPSSLSCLISPSPILRMREREREREREGEGGGRWLTWWRCSLPRMRRIL